ncbi:MAG: GIY-YIG nuclease family protein [Gammaproteobacteria bacterium]
MNWQVYIILCTDSSLYTGISVDAGRRFRQHARRRGARFFWGRVPERLVYLENGHDRSSASRREAAIKKLQRSDKLLLLASSRNEIGAVSISSEPAGDGMVESTE